MTARVPGPKVLCSSGPPVFADCAGCKEEIKHGQSLLALDKQWHVSCFKCQTCSVILTGEGVFDGFTDSKMWTVGGDVTIEF